MSREDIVITLFTIVYGLMLTDLFFSFHKLIRARKKIKWHWLPLLAAWYLFLIILKNWWDLIAVQDSAGSMNIFFFIAYGHLLFLLFLLVSTALPDAVEKTGINLKNYYFNNHRYFWGLMTSVVFLSVSITFFKRIGNLGQINLYHIMLIGIYLGFLFVLTISKKYWVHSVLVVLFVIVTIIEIYFK